MSQLTATLISNNRTHGRADNIKAGVPVWAEADAVHWAAMSIEDLGLTSCFFIHDPLQHVIWLLVNQIQVLCDKVIKGETFISFVSLNYTVIIQW